MAQEIVFGSEDSETVETSGRKNVVRKNVVPKTGNKLGDIAHYHPQQDETATWEEPCYLVEFNVVELAGLSFNGEKLQKGKHVVPQCQADYLGWQQNQRKKYDEGIYRGRTINRFLGNR